ncbi:hypothetical protein ABPG77_005209 [Micractinium sp. CCAP 211/92]
MRIPLLLIAAVACAVVQAAVAGAAGQLPSLHLDQPALLESALLLGGARRLHHAEGQGASMAPPQGGGSPGAGSQGSSQQGGHGGGGTQQGGKGGSDKGPAMPLSQWATETLAHDGWLMAAFVVAWAAAPGVALLVWSFAFDAVMSLASLLKAPASKARQLARMQSSSSLK